MENIIETLNYRKAEVAQYEANIAMYKSIADSLPSEYPEHLLKFKDSKNRHADIALIEDLNDVELLSDLWAHDDALAAVRAETVEKRKSEAILAFLEKKASEV